MHFRDKLGAEHRVERRLEVQEQNDSVTPLRDWDFFSPVFFGLLTHSGDESYHVSQVVKGRHVLSKTPLVFRKGGFLLNLGSESG